MQNIFEIKDDIYMNGERFRIISGILERPSGKVEGNGVQYGRNLCGMERP